MTILGIFIQVYIVGTLVLQRTLDMSYHWRILLDSTLPIAWMLINYKETGITLAEIKGSKLHLAAYGTSIALFLLCVQSSLGIIPVTHLNLAQASRPQMLACMIIIGATLGLTVVNLVIAVRDVNRREKGLPL